jgi:hypothetical protein
VSIEEAAQYVAAAYAVILAVVIAYFAISARRINGLRREVELLRREVEKRERRAGDAG